MKDTDASDEKLPKPNLPKDLTEGFTPRQRVEIETEYHDVCEWFLQNGKNPRRSIGLSETATRSKISRIAHCHAWVNKRKTARIRLSKRDADLVEQALIDDELTRDDGLPYAENSKRKMLDAIRSYFSYRATVHGGQPWSPSVSFKQSHYEKSDYFIRLY